MIGLLFLSGVFIAVFSAHTMNLRATVRAIGSRLVPQNLFLPVTIIQEAITPERQARNQIFMVLAWGFYALFCFLFLDWKAGLLLLALTTLIGFSAALFLIPKPMSGRFIRTIRENMESRLDTYKDSGDRLRSSALGEILRCFDNAIRD